MSEPYVGTVERITVTVYDETVTPRVLADPSTMVITVTTLTGVVTTYSLAEDTITRVSVGVYYADHLCEETGLTRVRVVTTGTAAGAKPGQFTVLGDG